MGESRGPFLVGSAFRGICSYLGGSVFKEGLHLFDVADAYIDRFSKVRHLDV